jgi:hypothetical protein
MCSGVSPKATNYPLPGNLGTRESEYQYLRSPYSLTLPVTKLTLRLNFKEET